MALAFVQVMSFGQSLAHVIQDWTQLENVVRRCRARRDVLRQHRIGEPTRRDGYSARELAGARPSSPSQGFWWALVRVCAAAATPYCAGGRASTSPPGPPGSALYVAAAGAAKSSLLRYILRLLEKFSPGSRITIDSIDITTRCHGETVRAAVAVVPRHPFFLKRTQPSPKTLYVLHRQQHWQEHEQQGSSCSKSTMTRSSMSCAGSRWAMSWTRRAADSLIARRRPALAGPAPALVHRPGHAGGQRIISSTRRAATLTSGPSGSSETAVCASTLPVALSLAVAHRLGAVLDFDHVTVMGGGRLLEWIVCALLKRDSEC